ncbi:hypothetical protein F2Q69_00030990 [Brassica cretica]|uniref:Uncharacterized protein n=1 Tax=Brassica cretica TaxID=69181 RepID=A0A8S9S107_BRACR|nr:hypothetical protein F2Q69_00030990 [Brassica cretica]
MKASMATASHATSSLTMRTHVHSYHLQKGSSRRSREPKARLTTIELASPSRARKRTTQITPLKSLDPLCMGETLAIWLQQEAMNRPEKIKEERRSLAEERDRVDATTTATNLGRRPATTLLDQEALLLANGDRDSVIRTQRREPHIGALQPHHDHPERSRATYDSQRTVTDNRASLESGEILASRNRNSETAIAETEEERICHIKGKAIATNSPASLDKTARLSTSLVGRNTFLTITEQTNISPQQNSREKQRYHLSTLEPNDLSLEPEGGLEQDIDAPLTELESADVDNLVLEMERLEMEENMLDIDNMIDVDNDDLLVDIPDHDAKKIEAIYQLFPATAAISKAAPPPSHQDIVMADATLQQALAPKAQPTPRDQTNPYVPEGLLKKKAPRSPDIKGSNASKKLQVLQSLSSRASPKKKIVSGKWQTSSSSKVPRNEVFPSALSKKSVSLAGSVVSQKPPSKKI